MTHRKEPAHLSYSSLSSYAECGEKYRLSRIYHRDNSTWWTTLGGSVGHELTEKWDLGLIDSEDAKAAFPKELDRHVAEFYERAGKDGVIKASGREGKSLTKTGGPNKKDRGWVEHYFPQFMQHYFDWRLTSGWTLLEIEGFGPAVEVPLEVDLGGEPSKGYIDRIFVAPQENPLGAALLGSADESLPEVVIMDLKFGQPPASQLQLKNYYVGLERQYGIRADRGCYYCVSSTAPMPSLDYSTVEAEFLDALYEQAWRGIRAGVFLPNVSSFCGSCSVREYCAAVGGSKAKQVPYLEEDLAAPEGLFGVSG